MLPSVLLCIFGGKKFLSQAFSVHKCLPIGKSQAGRSSRQVLKVRNETMLLLVAEQNWELGLRGMEMRV